LGRGELSKKLTVEAHRVTQAAQEKIEKAGGSVTKLELLLTGAKATIRKPRRTEIEALRAKRDAQNG
jgi:ribosomal protein L18E